ncbi:MAG: YebC/PmpR family DNA-binding transcriptional regulator [Bacteroidia bacterium]|nr:YebC/PmpR family DNA-binding transcriptional regulator [Bacteroidia bacterium]MDW8302082.1 YebC/PmpR family DNA-binding transcriptional regulator [Bacteroidia bacterium]
MGRIFEKRKYKMFARYDRMAKAFTRAGKEIAIAVRLGGPNPEYNPRLRMAIQNAKAVNMPKDRIEAAIKRAAAKEEADLEEVTYEAYAPHGVALVIEAATNNPTRTVANIRSYLNRAGGSLTKTGSLDFIFDRKGVFKLQNNNLDLETLELELIDFGLEELGHDEEGNIIIYSAFTDFANMQKALEDRKIEVISAEIQRIPNTFVELPEAQENEVLELIEKLESDDDVQNVYHNLK